MGRVHPEGHTCTDRGASERAHPTASGKSRNNAVKEETGRGCIRKGTPQQNRSASERAHPPAYGRNQMGGRSWRQESAQIEDLRARVWTEVEGSRM